MTALCLLFWVPQAEGTVGMKAWQRISVWFLLVLQMSCQMTSIFKTVPLSPCLASWNTPHAQAPGILGTYTAAAPFPEAQRSLQVSASPRCLGMEGHLEGSLWSGRVPSRMGWTAQTAGAEIWLCREKSFNLESCKDKKGSINASCHLKNKVPVIWGSGFPILMWWLLCRRLSHEP